MDTMSDAGFTQIFNCSQGVKWSLMFIEVFFLYPPAPLLKATVLGFSNESQGEIAISGMSISKPKCLARKRSGGVFAWVFLQVYGEVAKSSNLTDRTARCN